MLCTNPKPGSNLHPTTLLFTYSPLTVPCPVSHDPCHLTAICSFFQYSSITRRMRLPLACQKTRPPPAVSWMEKRPSFLPNNRWSRRFASSNRFLCILSCSIDSHAVPYIRCKIRTMTSYLSNVTVSVYQRMGRFTLVVRSWWLIWREVKVY